METETPPATFALIHGGGSSAWDWHLVEPELRQLDHDVIAVHLPIENGGNGITELADAAVAACAGRSNLAEVGHSFGGLVAPVVGDPYPLQAWPDVPTRYVLGRDDRCFPPDFTRALVAERLGIVPDEIDGGHMVALARPRAVAEQLHQCWIERHGTAPVRRD